MKSFINFLLEADYSRFLKKNKNLTKNQIELINDFFKRNRHAAKDFEKFFGWQVMSDKLTYDDFMKFMDEYGASKNIVKLITLKGRKGKDYWPVDLKNDSVMAVIPLNHEMATFLNSNKYGSRLVNYCIGYEDDVEYWTSIVIKKAKVPVYITNGKEKWVVMILEDNKKYEVWDKFNNCNVALHSPEPIPGLSIKNDLLTPKLGRLYDKIRREFFRLIKNF